MLKARWRRAALEDGPLIWRWRMDPEARRNSVHSSKFSLAHSLRWLEKKLADPRCLIVTAVVGTRKLGQLRLDLISLGKAEVGLSVARAARGKGLGTWMLKHLPRRINGKAVRSYVAFVKPENTASIIAFAKAGFRLEGLERHRGVEVCRLERRAR